MKKFRTLVLVTAEFPLGGITEKAFVSPEIKYLSEQFEEIIILPAYLPANQFDGFDLPPNVKVDAGFAEGFAKRSGRLPFLFHPATFKAVINSFRHSENPISAATYAAAALWWKKEIRKYICKHRLDVSNTLYYTFWFDAPTSGLALLSGESELNLISRVHGFEIRDIRSLWLKSLTMRNLKALYPVSLRAALLLRKLFPDNADCISPRHLGSNKTDLAMLAPAPNLNSTDLDFISVARLIPLKRVGLILELVREIARLLPSRRINWTHIGDGEEYSMLKEKAADVPPNLSVKLPGSIPNSEIHKLYMSVPFHWIILLSSSEGGVPISLCEGASYGIPAIATDVGGNSELVNESTGILTSHDPDISEVVKKVVWFLDNPDEYSALRKSIYRKWIDNFSADRLRKDFAYDIARRRWIRE